MLLHQYQLFSLEEAQKIRSYGTNLVDRVIGTYHPDVNNGEHDPNGGHNLAQHFSWNNIEYNWIYTRILDWVHSLNLTHQLDNLGSEFILQKYLIGFGFKPHIDHVAGPDRKSILRERCYTILIQLSDTSEYKGGDLFVVNSDTEHINRTVGTACIFGPAQLHWVTKITEGTRWSCTIFLERDALKKDLL